ncbi:MAG: hypothetical protein IPI11_09590 [Haliscomenobacter sp.]|nr:hypothetical protein [Haliscomenobacter sp.]
MIIPLSGFSPKPFFTPYWTFLGRDHPGLPNLDGLDARKTKMPGRVHFPSLEGKIIISVKITLFLSNKKKNQIQHIGIGKKINPKVIQSKVPFPEQNCKTIEKPSKPYPALAVPKGAYTPRHHIRLVPAGSSRV